MPTTLLSIGHGAVFARALILLAGSHLFVSATTADECRSCEFSRGIPPGLWQEFSESLAALDRFTLADEALAQRLAIIAGMPPTTTYYVIGDNLQRFSYPWRPELLHDRYDPGEPDTTDQAPGAADTAAPQPTWLHVPDPRDDNDDGIADDDRPLTVSATEVIHEPALATQPRASGKWYWEVRYLPGSANLPHAALLGIVDPALANAGRDPQRTMTALPAASFASLLGGEYLQFALDLDGRALHYAINGNWNSDPARAASGHLIAKRASFAPAVMPREPDQHPYVPDKFEFNFGASSFHYPMPAGYRPYDISTAQSTTPRNVKNAPVTGGAHERAFFAAVREFEQPFDPITDAKLREAVESWRVYRDAACLLSARFKKLKGAKTDPSCVRAFGGTLLAALSTLQHWNREAMDPPFDELPPIDLEQHPKLHYVELDGRLMPKDSTFLENDRRTTTVHVTDTSGPVILFLRADDATHWRITVEPGVNVQHVFLFGKDKQTATVPGKAASIRSYSSEQDNSGRLWRVLYKGDDDLAAMATALDTLIGVRPTSMQRGCKSARCEIAGDPK